MNNSTSQSFSIIKKTIQVGANTLISRIFGLTREILLMRFLGIGIMADAFTTAFMLPNSLRKIFAEGALTSAFVPTFVQSFKVKGKDSANSLMTLSFLIFESILAVLCIFIVINARKTILLIAPGYSQAQVEATIPLLQIMMPLIFFISSSALLAGALNSVNHFFIPAFAPTLLNTFFLLGIGGCLYFNYSVTFLCWTIMAGGAIQTLMHILGYFYYGFSFESFNKETIKTFQSMLVKFLLCFMSNSVMEIGLFIDQLFASYLPAGSVTLIKYAHRLMGIPLGVFVVAFSTILLPYFTRKNIDEPEKLEFYLNEALKLVLWITLPITLIMIFFAEKTFLTLFASSSSKFPVERLAEAGSILAAFLSGLIFFSLNKIFSTLFFALHDAKTPTIVTSLATLLNIAGNYLLVGKLGAAGLALATSLCAAFQTLLFAYLLHNCYSYRIHYKALLRFIMCYTLIIIPTFIGALLLYMLITKYIHYLGYPFFIKGIGFWFWVGPIIMLCFIVFYMTRKYVDKNMYFLR